MKGGVNYLLVFLCFLAGAVTAALATFSAFRHDEPGADWFAVLMCGASVWSLSYGIALATFDPVVRELLLGPIEVGQALIAPAWFLFALGYTGRNELVTPTTVAAIFVFPALTTAATFLDPSLLWTDFVITPTFGAATATFDPTLWYFVHAFYGYALVGVGLAFVFATVLSYGPLYRPQAAALVVGSLFPTVAHLAHTFSLGPYPALNATPFALTVTGLAFGYALFRFDLFGVLPATNRLGRRAALDDVGVAVAIVDSDERIVELNSAAEAAFGVDDATVTRRQLGSLLPDGVDVVPDSGDLLTVGEGATLRQYAVTRSSVDDHHGRTIGATVVFNDVTGRERRRQRVEVLNRVLRHNLRNELTVVMGHAETIAADAPDPYDGMAEIVRSHAGALVDLGEKARTLQSMLDREGVETDPFDAVAVVEESVADVREAVPAATIRLTAPPSVRVDVDPVVFASVVANLVENAAEHGGDTPTVEVSVRDDADDLVVVVSDDGPGLPDHELETIRRGRETALQHGSGIGLWLVHWGSLSLGGDVDYEANGGTRATLRLPESVDEPAPGDGGAETEA
jgi:signal transduction histidine kinase